MPYRSFEKESGLNLSGSFKRRSSSFNTARIDHIYQDPFEKKRNFFLHYGDVTDAISVSSLIKKIKPNEIYKAYDMMVDSLTQLLARERSKKAS